MLRWIRAAVGFAEAIIRRQVVRGHCQDFLVRFHGARAILGGEGGIRCRSIEEDYGPLLIFGKLGVVYTLGLGNRIDDLDPGKRGIMSSLGGLGVRVGNIEVGEGPDGVSLVLLRDAGLVAESDELVAILNGLREILLRAVILVIQRIDIVQKRRIGILRHEVVQHLDLRRRVLFSISRLPGVVLRHGVLLLAGSAASGALRHRRSHRDTEEAKRRKYCKACHPTCSVHSLISSLQPMK